jgi:hypothetical protein
MKSLTITFVTSRKEPKFEWFIDSLNRQVGEDKDWIKGLLIDSLTEQPGRQSRSIPIPNTKWVLPKPTIWQGKHRITKEDWWAKSNAMNTAIILCHTEWIAFVDDRSVLAPGWLNCVKEAMAGNYAVVGTYEKRSNMKVVNGEVMDMGEFLGGDDRELVGHPIDGKDWYGGSSAIPLEWCLAVNGFSEDLCDGLGSEDSMFGKVLRYAGFPFKFDSRMRIIQDRTPSQIDGALKRADKNPHLGKAAKSWSIVKAFYHKTTSQNSYDIRQHRARVQAGEDLWSIMPSASHYDWYDGQPISEMT